MTTRKHDVPDALLSGELPKPEDLIGENGLLKQLTTLLVEKALDAEMAAHLGHDKHEAVSNSAGNTRNGRSKKTLKGEFGELPIEVPATAKAASSRSWSVSTRPVGLASTTRFSPSMHAA